MTNQQIEDRIADIEFLLPDCCDDEEQTIELLNEMALLEEELD